MVEDSIFIENIWPQNCGDSLKIIKKTEQKKGTSYLWECEFIKYPFKVFVLKSSVLRGKVLNPQIEQVEFIDKIWPQNYGESLRIIKKSSYKIGQEYLWECEFIKYPCKVYLKKELIIKGKAYNKNLPFLDKEKLISYINNFFKEKPSLEELANSLNISPSHIGHKINEFNLREYISYSCNKLENEVKKYINTLNISFIENSLKELEGKEIDIYIPSFKLGFEFNGNYWHSSLYKKDNYHQEKSLLAKEKGINLLHIFEYEWLEKQEILKSLIKFKLGIFNKKIFARKCKIKELSNIEYKNFCNENHLQGYESAKIKLGLFYREELVQVMSFSLPRFTDKYEWEIIRECSKLDYIIVGGKEKLWKYFLKKYNPNSVISYCDFSKFTGDSYLKLGFNKERLNKPGFVWWDKKLNLTYPRSPHKHQEMKEAGYLKIYDCGQLVFVWER